MERIFPSENLDLSLEILLRNFAKKIYVCLYFLNIVFIAKIVSVKDSFKHDINLEFRIPYMIFYEVSVKFTTCSTSTETRKHFFPKISPLSTVCCQAIMINLERLKNVL